MDIEKLAESVHNAYLVTCKKLGWDVKPENQIPYSELIEDSKELDRASVWAVLDGIEFESLQSRIQELEDWAQGIRHLLPDLDKEDLDKLLTPRGE